MKFALVFLAVVGVACAENDLMDDLDDFLDLIPNQKFASLYQKYKNNSDVKKLMGFVQSSKFAEILYTILNMDEIRDIINYLEDEGVSVEDLLSKLSEQLGLFHWPSSSVLPTKSTRSLRNFFNEAINLLSQEKVSSLAIEKFISSESFRELHSRISDIDLKKLIDSALSHPEIEDFVTGIKKLGVDPMKIVELYQMFSSSEMLSF